MKKYCKMLFVLTAVLLFAACGCVRTEVGGDKMAFARKEKKSYKPVLNHNLELEFVTKDLLYAGEDAMVTFVLINRGSRRVEIEEWYTNEGDNLIISCQNWLPGTMEFDNDSWIRLEAPVRQPAWRYPLSLEPGSRIFIRKKLPFLEKLHVSPGGERRFFIKGELNLTSVKAASRVGTISVRNAADKFRKTEQTRKSRHFDR